MKLKLKVHLKNVNFIKNKFKIMFLKFQIM